MESFDKWYGSIEPDCTIEFSLKRYLPSLFYFTGLPLFFVGFGLWIGINGIGSALGDATFYNISDKILNLKRLDDIITIYGIFVFAIWMLDRWEKIINRI